MESHERGTPVVAAKIGGIPELIDHGENGILFVSGDAEAIVNIISELCENPKTVEKYRDNCKKLKRDGLSEYSTKLIRIYNA